MVHTRGSLRRLESYYYEGAKYLQSLEESTTTTLFAMWWLVLTKTLKPLLFFESCVGNHFNNRPLVATLFPSKDIPRPLQTSIRGLLQAPWKPKLKNKPSQSSGRLNEGFKTAQENQLCVAKGYNQTLLGVPVNGMNLVLKTVLGL